MNLSCIFGNHKWNGCKCIYCGKVRDDNHDWTKDCKKCFKCGKIRDKPHNWLNDCEECSNCKKTRVNKHDWSTDCEKCSTCGKTRENSHDWSKDCEKCSKCNKIRIESHKWDVCICSICGKTKHVWDDDICSTCRTIKKKTRNVKRIEKGDEKLKIPVNNVTHCFIALTLESREYSERAKDVMHDLQKACYPLVWAQVLKTKPTKMKAFVLAIDKGDLNFPNPKLLINGLEQMGIDDTYSIVCSDMKVGFDTPKIASNIFVGFCFKSEVPEFILPYEEGLIPG